MSPNPLTVSSTCNMTNPIHQRRLKAVAVVLFFATFLALISVAALFAYRWWSSEKPPRPFFYSLYVEHDLRGADWRPHLPINDRAGTYLFLDSVDNVLLIIVTRDPTFSAWDLPVSTTTEATFFRGSSHEITISKTTNALIVISGANDKRAFLIEESVGEELYYYLAKKQPRSDTDTNLDTFRVLDEVLEWSRSKEHMNQILTYLTELDTK